MFRRSLIRRCISHINMKNKTAVSQFLFNPWNVSHCKSVFPQIHFAYSCEATLNISSNCIRHQFEKRNTEFRNISISDQIRNNLESFNATYRDVYDDLTLRNHSLPALVAERLGRILNYNIPGGKKIRGLNVVLAYNMLSNGSHEAQGVRLAEILGWCVEILQGFFLVADDMMDDGEMRRGQPCWFRIEDVGLQAINDVLLLEAAIYRLLKMHFSELACYNKLVEEFHEVISQTVNGQCLDMATNPTNANPVYERLTLSNYKAIVELKTSYYTYCLPVHLAMHLIGGFSPEHYESTKAICLKLGYLFQIQDDYLDIYGDSNITGKVGTDIKDGKCTWFSSTAYENSSIEGKNLMKEFYGKNDESAVNKILQYFDSMSLSQKYQEMEEKLKTEITVLISRLDNNILNKSFFEILLTAIYKRQK